MCYVLSTIFVESVLGEMGDNTDGFANASGGELALYPPSIHHTAFCAHHGEWANSCDTDITKPTSDALEVPTIFMRADWSETCDPWKGVHETKTLDFNASALTFTRKSDGTIVDTWKNNITNWTCPEKHRSPSGCGDFRTDTRKLVCTSKLSIFDCGRPDNSDRRSYSVGELPTMRGFQRHVCVAHPIFYDNPNTDEPVVPPVLGRHRERWATWGEYDFLSPQRWMHNAEHGGVIFLYHQCLDAESLCAIRRYIQKWQKRLGKIKWRGAGNPLDDTDEFRFILTPFKDLFTPLAIVMWGHAYSSKCWNENDMDYFLEKWARNGFEDWPPNGAYRYLWKNITETAATCAPLPSKVRDHPRYMLTVQRPEPELGNLPDKITQLEARIGELEKTIANDSQSKTTISANVFLLSLWSCIASMLL